MPLRNTSLEIMYRNIRNRAGADNIYNRKYVIKYINIFMYTIYMYIYIYIFFKVIIFKVYFL